MHSALGHGFTLVFYTVDVRTQHWTATLPEPSAISAPLALHSVWAAWLLPPSLPCWREVQGIECSCTKAPPLWRCLTAAACPRRGSVWSGIAVSGAHPKLRKRAWAMSRYVCILTGQSGQGLLLLGYTLSLCEWARAMSRIVVHPYGSSWATCCLLCLLWDASQRTQAQSTYSRSLSPW